MNLLDLDPPLCQLHGTNPGPGTPLSLHPLTVSKLAGSSPSLSHW